MSAVIKTKISKGYQTVVPAIICDNFKCGPGDEIIWTLVGEDVFIHIKRKDQEDPIMKLIRNFETVHLDDISENLNPK